MAKDGRYAGNAGALPAMAKDGRYAGNAAAVAGDQNCSTDQQVAFATDFQDFRSFFFTRTAVSWTGIHYGFYMLRSITGKRK
jgi:hypothetical protein